jgi:hypothetical protein
LTTCNEDALGPLSRYDAEYGTALFTTRRLYVHANTLAYRLRTIRRLLGGPSPVMTSTPADRAIGTTSCPAAPSTPTT